MKHPEYIGQVGNTWDLSEDLYVMVLDQDVPENIKVAKVLPDNWTDYILSSDNAVLPALKLDQHENALVGDLRTTTLYTGWTGYRSPTTDYPDRIAFEERINCIPQPTYGCLLYKGDSSNPAFLVINSELVLMNVWTGGFQGSGWSIINEKNEINDTGSQH